MKKLIVINGTMGVGKSTIAKVVAEQLEPSVLLDGDWCWQMHPWHFSAENKRMVLNNIVYLLNAFLANSSFQYIIFCWVLPDLAILAQIRSRLRSAYMLQQVTLICSEAALQAHFKRRSDDFAAAYARMDGYRRMATPKLDVSQLTPEQAARRLLQIVS
ncbi:MAG: AAA family ATPase [Sporolactobacillus sp.]|jgi:adenylate kinase family enzyme|nr:AAA family ATPase [Sporolactobacillus sp.]MCI1881966.1 AAA family ATPase [Sporolactobacillus sp.]